MEKKLKCCLCGGDAGKYGNNAEPVKSGRCCDVCNSVVVIPARLYAILGGAKPELARVKK